MAARRAVDSTPVNRREFLLAMAASALQGLACAPLRPRPSVVCVLVDQLRRDAFHAWAPAVDRIAKSGVVFEQMRSVAPWTYPSVVSLLSGLLPQQHGADGHATESRLHRFDERVPLLQHILRAAGYRTAGFVTNPFLREWNPFHQGFDTYRSDFVRFVGDRRPRFHEFALPEMFAPSVNSALREHFDRQPADAPEFTYVHYIDVLGPWTRAPFRPIYRAAVEFIDRKIFEVYQYFLRRYDGNVLFLVTSDHGLPLGDDLVVGEGPKWRRLKASPHEFNLRIPFAVLPSEAMTETRSVATACSNIDVVPTLLEWLGIEWPVPLPGRSLLPALRGRPLVDHPPSYARTSAFKSRCDGLVVGGRKYMRFFDVASGAKVAERAFDLRADPLEHAPLASGMGDAGALFVEAAGDRGLAYAAIERAPAGELERQLRALCYLEGGSKR